MEVIGVRGCVKAVLPPKLRRCYQRCDLYVGPPRKLVAVAMELLMMLSAQWHGKFVADLAPEGSRLGKFQMVRITGRAMADQTRLRGNERPIGFVAFSKAFLNWQRALVLGVPLLIVRRRW